MTRELTLRSQAGNTRICAKATICTSPRRIHYYDLFPGCYLFNLIVPCLLRQTKQKFASSICSRIYPPTPHSELAQCQDSLPILLSSLLANNSAQRISRDRFSLGDNILPNRRLASQILARCLGIETKLQQGIFTAPLARCH